ncbi:hypothetical protein H0H81_000992 [Sphagnurus paluster]|uniref:Uncharacterized protein n=1 Tax=Sphagnurus paluster TaxID=117069 RepID=A0A9P7K2W5_9AGAR|nr:hypothetical protein H0H81_000992 [Sphagnurus paluster]
MLDQHNTPVRICSIELFFNLTSLTAPYGSFLIVLLDPGAPAACGMGYPPAWLEDSARTRCGHAQDALLPGARRRSHLGPLREYLVQALQEPAHTAYRIQRLSKYSSSHECSNLLPGITTALSARTIVFRDGAAQARRGAGPSVYAVLAGVGAQLQAVAKSIDDERAKTDIDAGTVAALVDNVRDILVDAVCAVRGGSLNLGRGDLAGVEVS